jgi:hypothetical protein
MFFFFIGVVSDLISVNRKILEENQFRLRKMEAEQESIKAKDKS